MQARPEPSLTPPSLGNKGEDLIGEGERPDGTRASADEARGEPDKAGGENDKGEHGRQEGNLEIFSGVNMSTGNFEEMINKYFDEELSKREEIFLFSTLSQDGEAREYFKKMNLLKNAINKTIEDFPAGLEERILYSVERKASEKKYDFSSHKLLRTGSYAVTVLLLIVSVYLFFEVRSYKQEVTNAVNVIMEKSTTIELLLNNTLPAAEVKAEYYNEIIVKPTL